jgi:O-succinylbenzoic acid--CoA ligase
MESLALFDLKELHRDWIEGTSADAFFSAVEANLNRLKDQEGKLALLRLAEPDPVGFAAHFFAAVYLRVPVALVNPKWGAREREQFEALIENGRVERGSILIPTGGTSGRVKLAIHDWFSLKASAEGLASFLGCDAIHSCCQLPLYHVSGLMQLIRSFVTGGSIRFDNLDLSGYCISLVPTQLQRMLSHRCSIQKLETARAIFVGGAAMPKTVEAKARELRLPVIPVYGMTETAAMVAAVPNEDFLGNPVSGALPLGGAEFSIEDDGRVRIKTSALFQGYCGGAPLDRSAGFIVNDEGYLDGDGRLHILGRSDRLINTGGEKVDPREVESALLELEEVMEALVVSEPDAEWGEKVVAFVVGPCEGKGLEWFRDRLRPRLAAYKLPRELRSVRALPLDSRGKYMN